MKKWFITVDNATQFKALSHDEEAKLSDEEKGEYLADMIKGNHATLETLSAKMKENPTEELEKKYNELFTNQVAILKNAVETQGV